MKSLPFRIVAALACCAGLSAPAPAQIASHQPASRSASHFPIFEITFDPGISDKPYTGRVWLMTGRISGREPRFGLDWFFPSPFFAMDVTDWKPGAALRFDELAIGFPNPLSQLKTDDIRVQAVISLNPDARQHGEGEGNAYSRPIRIRPGRSNDHPIRIKITRKVEPTPINDGGRITMFEMPSRLLTKFHHRPIKITGAIVLPEEYDERPNDRFPTLYTLPGFGQTRATAHLYLAETNDGDCPIVRVLLDADCGTGLHEFADSANNGPYGQAMIEEVIPWLEKKYRLVSEPSARFLSGHSSGGWASLWLQVTYPDYFSGTWSTSPDPVDFRELSNLNVYKNDNNAFRDSAGKLRPLARMAGRVLITFKQFSDMDNVVGQGEQLGSFEAVFSPRGTDGRPMRLWDRKTGRLDAAVAKAWEKYDIRLVLERNWTTLGPKLAGKLHIYVGDQDTFYLNKGVASLKAALTKLGSDADIRILEDLDHFDIMMSKDMQSIPHDAAQQYAKSHPTAFRKPAAPSP